MHSMLQSALRQQGQPAELQMPNPTRTCPLPSTGLIPPHDHPHPWMTHRGRGAHPPVDLHPRHTSKQRKLRLEHFSVGSKPT